MKSQLKKLWKFRN